MAKFTEVVKVSFWGAVAFGFLYLAIHLVELWHKTTALGWDRVPCTIEKFAVSIEPPEGKIDSLKIELEYRYQAGGKEWTSTRWEVYGNRCRTYEEISDHLHELTGELPTADLDLKGRTVFCRVDENDFSRSVLIPDRRRFVFECSAAGVVLLFVVAAVVLGRRVNPQVPRDALPAAFVLFFVFSGLAVSAFFAWKLSDYLAMRKWVEAPGTVVESRVEPRRSSMKPRLHFRYEYDGREYRASRFDVIEASHKPPSRRSIGRGGERTSDVIAAHPPGQPCTVFVDPAKPWHAVIDRSASGFGWLTFFTAVWLGVGSGGLWFLLRKPDKGSTDKARKRKAKRERKRS